MNSKIGALLVLALFGIPGCAQPPIDSNDQRRAYTLAEELMWSGAEEILVRVGFEDTQGPFDLALDRLVDNLQLATGKLVSLDVQIGISSGYDETHTWTTEELFSFDEQYHGRFWRSTDGGPTVFHAWFLGGDFVNDGGVVAAGFQHKHIIAMWPDQVRRALLSASILGQSFGPPNLMHQEAVTGITIHELGHLLGLVGWGAPMIEPRHAPNDTCLCHSRHASSVMYPGAEAFNATRFVEEGAWARSDFDKFDWDDLRAFRALDPNAPRVP